MEPTGQAHANRTEFELHFKRTYRHAFKLAYRLAGNESDAQDLTQEAFVRAWGSFDRYDRRRPFEVWLFRILCNLATDRWRRRSSLRMYSLDGTCSADGTEVRPLGAVLPDRAPGPEQQCMRNVLGEEIQAALWRLPEHHRTVIILTYIEQRTYEEVAQKMRCPVGTVRSRLHRGRLALREMLTPPAEASMDEPDVHQDCRRLP
jgi:RNA polymerase sigma-70 factor (ECF subfamily)